MIQSEIETIWRGRIGYAEALDLQTRRVGAIQAGMASDALFLLEHDPVFTLGRSASEDHVLASRDELARRGIQVERTGRGGQVTYHGPGQLVGYPILDLRRQNRNIGQYVRDLEAVLIDVLAHFGVTGTRITGRTGVWVSDAKIAAIGIHVARWVTMHGFALNVTTDLDLFARIVPCGQPGARVTSLEQELGRAIPLEMVGEVAARCFGEVFGCAIRWKERERQVS